MKFYSNLAQAIAEPSMLGYVRVLKRAWDEKEGFGLSGVLCVEGVPTLYKKVSKKVLGSGDIFKLHRRFWNQSVASILLIIDPKTVYLVSGLQPPQESPQFLDSDSSPVVEQWLKHDFSRQHEEELFETILNGDFYRRYDEKFRSAGAVDLHLTRNLLGLRNQLSPVLKDRAPEFICRLLFVCYLVDRGIVPLQGTKCKRLHEALEERTDEEAVDWLYTFFASQKKVFNGSMFDQDLDAEKLLLGPSQMHSVKMLLRGDSISKGERTLGFWAYDFRLIPVETISAIYENFLEVENRKKTGSHYTPRVLAEMALDIATEDRENWHNVSYLDPSCGSGIFLVILFNRLVTKWEMTNETEANRTGNYKRKEQALRKILDEQIRGMDIKTTACVLACFSLYVAFLDAFNPSDIKTYIQKTGHNRLPKLFVKANGRETGENLIPVVMEGDSLNSTRLRKRKYDVIIGNPPWGGDGRGSGDPALKFLNLTDDLIDENGHACLLLPSKLHFNIFSNKDQEKWLGNHTLERVLQLADFRRILFPEAKCATMILRFMKGSPADARHEIIYDAPKFDPAARRQGFVSLTSADRKLVPQARMHDAAKKKKANVVWKQLLWGTPRDERLLGYLETFQKIEDRAGKHASQKPWREGQGIQPDEKKLSKKPEYPWWEPDHLFVSATSPCLSRSLFLLEGDANKVGVRFTQLYFSREANKKIFQPPMVLVSQGFGKVVYCDFPVLFQHSLQSIHGSPEDEDLLLFLSAYLRSDLAKYFLFHTSSKLGIERDVVRWDEVLKLPFPVPDDAPSEKAESIVRKVADLLRASRDRVIAKQDRLDNDGWLGLRAKEAAQLQSKTNKLVNEYFGLLENEEWLVDDAVSIYWKSATPSSADEIDIPTLIPVDQCDEIPGYENGLQTYADVLASTLNSWAIDQNSHWRVYAEGGIDQSSGLAMVAVMIGSKERDFRITPLIHEVWKDIFGRVRRRQHTLSEQRQVLVFDEVVFRILRPSSLVHWTRSSALNDADQIYSQIKLMGAHAK